MKEIILPNNKVALVDDDDYEYINQWKWHCNTDGYAVRNIWIRNEANKKVCRGISMHRTIAKTPKGMETDHINHQILDNRRSNLRICTNSQNHINLKKTNNKTSGVRGVSWGKKEKHWRAQIELNGKKYYLGIFNNIEDAAVAYKSKAIELFGEFACFD
jgi:hypothetical protein